METETTRAPVSQTAWEKSVVTMVAVAHAEVVTTAWSAPTKDCVSPPLCVRLTVLGNNVETMAVEDCVDSVLPVISVPT